MLFTELAVAGMDVEPELLTHLGEPRA